MGIKKKKSKRCSIQKRLLWYVFGAVGLGARGLAALALVAIALKMSPLKNEARLFNDCVKEQSTNKSISESVRFCNGGN